MPRREAMATTPRIWGIDNDVLPLRDVPVERSDHSGVWRRREPWRPPARRVWTSGGRSETAPRAAARPSRNPSQTVGDGLPVSGEAGCLVHPCNTGDDLCLVSNTREPSLEVLRHGASRRTREGRRSPRRRFFRPWLPRRGFACLAAVVLFAVAGALAPVARGQLAANAELQSAVVNDFKLTRTFDQKLRNTQNPARAFSVHGPGEHQTQTPTVANINGPKVRLGLSRPARHGEPFRVSYKRPREQPEMYFGLNNEELERRGPRVG